MTGEWSALRDNSNLPFTRPGEARTNPSLVRSGETGSGFASCGTRWLFLPHTLPQSLSIKRCTTTWLCLAPKSVRGYALLPHPPLLGSQILWFYCQSHALPWATKLNKFARCRELEILYNSLYLTITLSISCFLYMICEKMVYLATPCYF